MGLDMFLQRKYDDVSDEEQLFYWRKAYPIMDWFENRYDCIHNCEKYDMSYDDLCDLRDWCRKVIEADDFTALDEFDTIEWTTEYEKSQWKDYHMGYVRDTYDFLTGFLSRYGSDDEIGSVGFLAWW